MSGLGVPRAIARLTPRFAVVSRRGIASSGASSQGATPTGTPGGGLPTAVLAAAGVGAAVAGAGLIYMQFGQPEVAPKAPEPVELVDIVQRQEAKVGEGGPS